jgi:hypothetical protein
MTTTTDAPDVAATLAQLEDVEPQLAPLTKWRAHQERWRRSLCAELFELPSPIRTAQRSKPVPRPGAQYSHARCWPASARRYGCHAGRLETRCADSRIGLRTASSGSGGRDGPAAGVVRFDSGS